MTTSRRSFLTLSALMLASPALIRPAQAADCAQLDLARGIVFKRQDGSRGLARREADGLVSIDYVTNRGEWLDRRRVKHGVFEVERIVQESEFPVVGASAPTFTWTFSPKTVEPKDGMNWQGSVKELVEVTISDENATLQRTRNRWAASFRCFEPREVKLSGCTHSALTVEAEFAGKSGSSQQRWVYFPNLRLGLETKVNGKANGLTALQPA